MNREEINQIVEKQREYFRSGATLDVSTRLMYLRKLKACVKKNEKRIAAALLADLGKSDFEGYMCETGITLSELTYMIRHTAGFAAPRRVRTPLAQFHSKSFVQSMPYGVTLIMSPWNYPLLLTLEPLTDAIAAGNTAIVKPSAYSPYTGEVVKDIIEECFPPEYVAVVMGGREENTYLLDAKFDYIFFTGSKEVGRTVLAKAAPDLTPATLELGGKSPCIVDSSANLRLAARRIVFGKYLNCGQTCVAPDYVLCDSSVKDRFIEQVKVEIMLQYGEDCLNNENYGKIINSKHFRRICGLIDEEKTVYGGARDEENLRIEPTVMEGVTFDDPVMKEEIFGPVLPVIEVDTQNFRNDVIRIVNENPRPLALYVFADDKAFADNIIKRCTFGGGCINDTIIHIATSNMGFGGNGESGMGAYHGRVGFETFSHMKSVVDKKTWLDIPMRYQPYSMLNEKLLRLFLR